MGRWSPILLRHADVVESVAIPRSFVSLSNSMALFELVWSFFYSSLPLWSLLCIVISHITKSFPGTGTLRYSQRSVRNIDFGSIAPLDPSNSSYPTVQMLIMTIWRISISYSLEYCFCSPFVPTVTVSFDLCCSPSPSVWICFRYTFSRCLAVALRMPKFLQMFGMYRKEGNHYSVAYLVYTSIQLQIGLSERECLSI